MHEPPEQVLVVRTGAIGDVVNALVFATALKAAWPGVRIGWVAHGLVRPLLEGHPDVDRVHAWDRERGPAGLVEVAREVRRVGYDLAVDLQRITKSALLARLSGAPRVLGFDRPRTKEGSWLWTNERVARPAGDASAEQHMLERYLEVAGHVLGASGPPPALHRFPPDEDADATAAEIVERAGASPVVAAVGATKPVNRWEPARFGRLAARLAREAGVPVCLTGGPAERAVAEEALAAARAESGSAAVLDLVGQTSLRELSALLGRSRAFVGCDTGPMHLAAARGVPVVALFGPADPRRTGPYPPVPLPGGPRHRIVRVPPPCAPCNRKTCNQPRHACMEDLSVEAVFEAVRESLEETRAVSAASDGGRG